MENLEIGIELPFRHLYWIAVGKHCNLDICVELSIVCKHGEQMFFAFGLL